MKKFQLEKILADLPLTHAYLLAKYGADLAQRKQLFIAKNDAVTISRKMMLDLDSWNLEKFKISFTNRNHKLENIPSIAFSPFVSCLNEKCLNICYGTNQKFLSFFKFFYQVENTFFFLKYPDEFIKKFDAFLSLFQPRFFRFFENGRKPHF